MPAYGKTARKPRASRTMATWSLVLAVLVCLPLAWPVSVVLALVVIVRSLAGGENRGVGLAVTALVVDVVWVGLVVAAFTTGLVDDLADRARGGDTALADLQAGDCFDESARSTAGGAVTVVDCTERHDYQALERVRLPGTDYPGDDRISARVDKACAVAFRAEYGAAPQRTSVSLTSFYPRRDAWDDGDHVAVCAVSSPGGASTGSLVSGTP